jgi:rsbT antagonist protein RsbS
MKVTILRLGRDLLIVPIHAEVTDEDVLLFQSDLTEGVALNDARGVVIDVSALDIVDSFMARILNDTARMLGMMEA